MRELHGRILTPSGLVRGTIRFSERIEEVVAAEVDGPLLLPGFIDLHVHGGGGGDTMDGQVGIRQMARFHLEHGVTTILPTTITNPWPRVIAALGAVARLRSELRAPKRQDSKTEGEPSERLYRPEDLLPDIPGAHLEGPFISAERLGAQPPDTLLPSADLVLEALRTGAVKVATVAPELPGALEAAEELARAGVRISVGHTRADYRTVSEFARAVRSVGGVLGFTHLFNAMGGIDGRAPGIAGAALAHRESYAEMIYDGHHVAEGSLHLARAAKPGRLLLVSDCIRAAGTDDSRTELGGQRVTVHGGAARLDDGTLAGSVLTLDRALRNVLRAGVPLSEASAMLSAVPARYLGLADRGELALGMRADIVALNEEFEVEQVLVAGRATKTQA